MIQNVRLADIIRANSATTNLQDNVFFFNVEIAGRVWNDLNGDAHPQQGEPGLPRGVTLLDDDNTVVATTLARIFPCRVAITPHGTRAYVANIINSISVIDTATNTVVVTIPSGQFPTGLAITPDGTRAYVPDQQDFIVSVIDTATNTVVTTIPVSATAGVAITPDGNRAYVTSPGEGTVSVIDTATNTVLATISLGTNQNPFGVAITPDGTRAYVTINFPNNVVAVIDTLR